MVSYIFYILKGILPIKVNFLNSIKIAKLHKCVIYQCINSVNDSGKYLFFLIVDSNATNNKKKSYLPTGKYCKACYLDYQQARNA